MPDSLTGLESNFAVKRDSNRSLQQCSSISVTMQASSRLIVWECEHDMLNRAGPARGQVQVYSG